jgi:methionine-gamma-lyase
VLGSGAFMPHLFETRNTVGGMLGPGQAVKVMEGMKTLEIRLAKMQENARVLAEILRGHPEVETVYYPGFDTGQLLNGQMKGPGYMIAFVLRKGIDGGRTFVDSMEIAPKAVSLGGVETLICHPASTTHAIVPREEREAKGITDGLLRLSVGIEGINDLRRDIESALAAVTRL